MARNALTSMCFTAGLLCAPVVVAEEIPARSVEQIRACVQANLPEKSMKQSFSLESFDRGGGSRTLVGKLFADQKNGKDRLMMAIDAPLDLRGVRYLMLEKKTRDDMFMYLPSLSKVRRIRSSQMQDTSLFGTDFSYEDIKQISGNFARGDVSQGEDGDYKGQPIYTLILKPMADKESAYSKVVSMVDQQSCVVLKTEFYSATQGVVKRLESDPASLKETAGKHWLGQLSMHDLVAETHTNLTISEVQYDKKISLQVFNPNTFHKSN